ncbi:proton channel OtopLc isoform X1 [Dermacentor andersoni]|uniref:proton channel OtopLc isoform X1 n=1 Tax=Dermacentor andersoni TaxID=34620 RepID=UPI00215573EB|nr:proton channel OtopLc-like isoform X1 [Dermacentor andersoni]
MPHRRRLTPSKAALVTSFPCSGLSLARPESASARNGRVCSLPAGPSPPQTTLAQPVIMVKNGISFLQNNLSLVKIAPTDSPAEVRRSQGLVVSLDEPSSGAEMSSHCRRGRTAVTGSPATMQRGLRGASGQQQQQQPLTPSPPQFLADAAPPPPTAQPSPHLSLHQAHSFSRTTSYSTINPDSVSSPGNKVRPKNPKTQQFIMVSSMYCQLLVVICVVFFTSEVVTFRVPLYYFEGFYMYLYSVSLLFLLYVYIYLLRRSSPTGSGAAYRCPKKITILENLRRSVGDKAQPNKGLDAAAAQSGGVPPRLKKQRISENDRSHGSLFLRIGAIAFGLGTMVYNGLEFGSFFEIPSTSPCYSVLLGINPVLQMVFTFAQMYFIFMNARLNIHKFKVVARFGLMHVVATNICVWIRTLGKETLQEINEHHLRNGRGSTLEELILPFRVQRSRFSQENASQNFTNPCEKQDIMGTIVSDSSPFLYPFIVEYSLISAAVLYVMWKNIGKDPVYHVENSHDDGISRTSSLQAGSKVNCTGSSKGLFFGLLVLVCSTICLIVFFVLIQHERYAMLAIYLSDLSHCGIKVLTIGAITIGFFRIKSLRFHPDRKDHLRSILLSVAAFGLYVYAMFGIIAGSLLPKDHIPNLLVMVTSILTIVQVTMQSLFIADITCRMTYLPEHDHSKPGRQVITFLLIGNLTLWIIYTFEKQKVEASPVQLGFYGFMAWTVIIRASLPLSIFYRFHSSVTFAEVWKNSYRNMGN